MLVSSTAAGQRLKKLSQQRNQPDQNALSIEVRRAANTVSLHPFSDSHSLHGRFLAKGAERRPVTLRPISTCKHTCLRGQTYSRAACDQTRDMLQPELVCDRHARVQGHAIATSCPSDHAAGDGPVCWVLLGL
jgi:hypothetical protein